MTSKVVKSTVRGQITLPKQWRGHFDTDSYLVEMHDDKLVIMPFNLELASQEEVLFDADRDNDGKGISPDDIIKTLKSIDNG
ncbi:MAG: AbrB/MazE/SpoVT family DNA-binding domain-containing protein [Patescibacteria group bacterium]